MENYSKHSSTIDPRPLHICEMLGEIILSSKDVFFTKQPGFMDTPSQVYFRTENLANGASGALWFLVNLYRISPRDALSKGIDYLVERLKYEAVSVQSNNYGLYNGRAGLALTLIYLSTHLKDKNELGPAEDILYACDRFIKSPETKNNFYFGRAGTLVVLLHLFNLRRTPKVFELIKSCVSTILNESILLNDGVFWNIEMSQGAPKDNFNFGSKGILWSLSQVEKYFSITSLKQFLAHAGTLPMMNKNGESKNETCFSNVDYESDLRTLESLIQKGNQVGSFEFQLALNMGHGFLERYRSPLTSPLKPIILERLVTTDKTVFNFDDFKIPSILNDFVLTGQARLALFNDDNLDSAGIKWEKDAAQFISAKFTSSGNQSSYLTSNLTISSSDVHNGKFSIAKNVMFFINAIDETEFVAGVQSSDAFFGFFNRSFFVRICFDGSIRVAKIGVNYLVLKYFLDPVTIDHATENCLKDLLGQSEDVLKALAMICEMESDEQLNVVLSMILKNLAYEFVALGYLELT